jgi:hypothetical protein
MTTTLGATLSKTLANALLSWWTTSLPASAAKVFEGTVGGGAISGVAAKMDKAAPTMRETKIGNKRMAERFDSIQRATFSALCPTEAFCGTNRLQLLGESALNCAGKSSPSG